MQSSQQSMSTKRGAARHMHSKGLLAIGLFKLGKALVFFAIGMGALHFLNADLSDSISNAATALKFDPESHFVSVLLDKADMIDDHELKLVSMATLAYSVVATVEGVGLLLEQTWAEYLTLIISIAFLPWELVEVIRRTTTWRVSIITANLLIVVYLLWFVRNHKRQKAQRLRQAAD